MSRLTGSRVMTFMDRECELALVARLRAADPEAFDDVYNEFNPRLFSFLARLSRSRQVAEDLLGDVAALRRAHAAVALGRAGRRLSMVAPDPAWADQLRARCRTNITQRAKPPSQSASPRIPGNRIIATAASVRSPRFTCSVSFTM